MQVNYSYLDESFKQIGESVDFICFGGIFNNKRGKYVSYTLTIVPTDVNRKFYREMVKLWGKFLEKPVKELNVKGNPTHIVMDMDKYSISFIVSVFSSFRFLTDGYGQPAYYVALRNKYRKLPIFSALVACQIGEKPETQEHCFIPWSGVPYYKLQKVLSMTLEEKLPIFERQSPLNKSGSWYIFASWGYSIDYYPNINWPTVEADIEKEIVNLFYNKKGKK